MMVWCGLSADHLDKDKPNLVALPEDVDRSEIDRAEARCPGAIITGAISEKGPVQGVVSEKGFMRGVIWHRGRNWIDYLKVGNDGRASPSPRSEHPDIYVSNGLAVGLLVCMDFDIPAVRDRVIGQLHESAAQLKVLCVPSGMSRDWFPVTPISPPSLEGIHVVVSNNMYHGDNRHLSFITDRNRMPVTQLDKEPICMELDVEGDGGTI